MRKHPLLLQLILTCACLAGLAANAADDAPRPGDAIFNGRDIDAWHSYFVTHGTRTADVFTVKDGAIVCKGEPMGYLYTPENYKNYRLRLEWRWAPGQKPGNSGIFLRLNGKPGFLPRCVEVQLQSGNAGDIYAFAGMNLKGDPDRFREIDHKELGKFVGVKRIGESAEKPAGEWNAADIRVHDGEVEVYINGKLVNKASGLDDIAGPVGLQSEGGEIHFRNINLAPMRN